MFLTFFVPSSNINKNNVLCKYNYNNQNKYHDQHYQKHKHYGIQLIDTLILILEK